MVHPDVYWQGVCVTGLYSGLKLAGSKSIQAARELHMAEWEGGIKQGKCNRKWSNGDYCS